MEQWQDIPGYEGLYQVSNTGKVKSLARVIKKKMYGGGVHLYTRKERLKKFDKSIQGYLTVELSNNGLERRYKVHRLVATAYIPNPDNKPFVNHKDNDPSNNNFSNLEWCTSSENAIHSVKQGRWAGKNNLPKNRKGSDVATSKLTEDMVKTIRASTLSQRELASKYGVSKTAIRFIQINKSWKHV